MKFSTVSPALLVVLSAAAESPKESGTNSTIPFFSCGSATDLLNITHFQIDPFPVHPGKNVSVSVAGNLSEQLQNGTIINIMAAMGPIRILNATKDLCYELAKNNISSCPIKQGSFNFTGDWLVPKTLPEIELRLTVRAKTPEGKQVACIDGLVAVED